MKTQFPTSPAKRGSSPLANIRPQSPNPPPNLSMMRDEKGNGVGSLHMLNIKPSLTSSAFDASAPQALLHLYYPAYHGYLDSGQSDSEAHRRAIREVRRAGWYKGKNGWTRLGPDLRDKVNVVEAIQQPDGKYLIEGVPTFYSNNAKGVPFDDRKVDQFIENTNRFYRASGNRAAITDGHVESGIGKQSDALGGAINFRRHPEKKHLVFCDLVDVDPEYVRRMQQQKLPGVSLGFAKDAGELSRRVGHVALLGGASPALAYLPATEVFSVSGNYLCFSADEELFPKGNPMSPKMKDCYAAMDGATDMYAAAKQSRDVGEPGHEEKIKEAMAALREAQRMLDEAMNEEGGMDNSTGTASDNMPVPSGVGEYGGQPEAGMQSGGNEEQPSFSAIADSIDLSDPKNPYAHEQMFAAQTDEINRLGQEMAEARQIIADLQHKARTDEVRKMAEQYSSTIENFRRQGKQGLPTPGKEMKEQFATFGEFDNPRKAMDMVLKQYSRLPSARTPATINNGEPMFHAGADDGSGRLSNVRPMPGSRQTQPRIVATPSLSNGDPIGEDFAAAADEMFGSN